MLLLYANTITPRLRYIAGFFSRELFDEPIRLTVERDEYLAFNGPRLNYSSSPFSEEEFHLEPEGILFETGIRSRSIECFELNFHKAFFPCRGDFPFDIFGASFYLLSRYEEYLAWTPDEYGRYPHTQSLACREGFLQQPLINIWLVEFKAALLRKFPSLLFRRQNFRCLVTYDIDIAWSYRQKGLVRTAGGLLRSLLQGKPGECWNRIAVLRGKRKDPYDCYEWLDALHLYCRLKPYYFFLVAGRRKEYDRNISTNSRAFRNLIEYYAQTYKIGLHPSWQSGDRTGLLKEEKEWLETVADRPVTASRQHYIRFSLPETYKRLLAAGLEKDFSMGYGSINGFRASVCSSFYWYNLEAEEQTGLLVYPFCFMDANSFYEQKHSPEEAYRELTAFYEQVKKCQGMMVSIWHNNLLGNEPHMAGWRNMFELFMKETVYWDAYYDAG